MVPTFGGAGDVGAGIFVDQQQFGRCARHDPAPVAQAYQRRAMRGGGLQRCQPRLGSQRQFAGIGAMRCDPRRTAIHADGDPAANVGMVAGGAPDPLGHCFGRDWGDMPHIGVFLAALDLAGTVGAHYLGAAFA